MFGSRSISLKGICVCWYRKYVLNLTHGTAFCEKRFWPWRSYFVPLLTELKVGIWAGMSVHVPGLEMMHPELILSQVSASVLVVLTVSNSETRFWALEADIQFPLTWGSVLILYYTEIWILWLYKRLECRFKFIWTLEPKGNGTESLC